MPLIDSKLSLDGSRSHRHPEFMALYTFRLYCQRIDNEKNMARHYAPSIQPTLFGVVEQPVERARCDGDKIVARRDRRRPGERFEGAVIRAKPWSQIFVLFVRKCLQEESRQRPVISDDGAGVGMSGSDFCNYSHIAAHSGLL